jgi:hypothetical protein
LAESYEYRPNSEFLLVVNCEISKIIIDKWKSFANSIGSSVDIWNISNYGGFSFNQPLARYDVELIKLLKNKVVIFYNNTFPDTKNIT